MLSARSGLHSSLLFKFSASIFSVLISFIFHPFPKAPVPTPMCILTIKPGYDDHLQHDHEEEGRPGRKLLLQHEHVDAAVGDIEQRADEHTHNHAQRQELPVVLEVPGKSVR